MKNKKSQEKEVQLTVNQLIRKWDLPQAWCARKMGISRNSFWNKLNGVNQYYSFKEQEQDRLIKALKELSKDIGRL
jgi:DNA-binding CsgD family transcriptional regulator